MRVRLLLLTLVLTAIAAPPVNPDHKKIAAYLADYMGDSSPSRITDIETMPPIARGGVTLAEFEKIIQLLESRIGKEMVQAQLKNRKSFYAMRLATLRALVATCDFLASPAATDARLVDSISNFTGPNGNLGEILKTRFRWKLLPAVLKPVNGAGHHKMVSELAKIAASVEALPTPDLLRPVFQKYIPDFAKMEEEKFASWGRGRPCHPTLASLRHVATPRKPTEP